MADSDNPQPNPEPEPDHDPGQAAGGGVSGPPPEGPQSSAPLAVEPQINAGGPPSSIAPGSSGRFANVKRLAPGRRRIAAAVALLCVAAGAVGSVLGAHALARTDAAKARQSFKQSVTATGIASTVKQNIQREEDLLVSASTFFAANPKATPAEFSAWTKWANALHRYPELEGLGFVAFVRAEPAPSLAVSAAHPVTLGSSGSTRLEGGRVQPLAASKPSYYCSSTAELTRSANGSTVRAGHCALTPGLLSARESGLSSYTATSVGHTPGLAIVAPVYKGGVLPYSLAGRRAAFVGWLHEALAPGVVLQQALRGHPNGAVRVRYRAGRSNVVFASGAPQSGAQSVTTDLHDGWTVRSFAPAAVASVLADGHAVALLIAGCVLSALVGLLVFFLGAGRAPELVPTPAPESRELVREDLYDTLTGLPNRTLMMDLAVRMIARVGRQSGMLAGALLIDIDWFNDVNEKLGRAAGDQLLRIVAERLDGVVRAQDTVGRFAADKFLVLVESPARGARLDSLARRVIEAMHKPISLDAFGPSFFATASIGVAFGRYATPDDLLRDAQEALSSAKAEGKDRYTLFNANMRSVIEGRGVLEAELNAALRDGQFFLLYQPIYDLTTRKIAALEALIRWRHPKKGVLAPGEFIPVAEETGLIVPIGRWALEEACVRAAAWNVAGHRAGVSVTVSPTQLNREGFATDVRRALQQSGIEPSLLTLEIAETTVMQDVAAAAERLQQIKLLGVRIAIDDFGSGYAYRADLQRMPLDFLKVDRSSLAASEDEDYRSWLLEAILVFGRDLALTVVAKGIDTYAQMTTLQAMGCSMAQGFFMGRPTPADGVESLFDEEFPAAPAADMGHQTQTDRDHVTRAPQAPMSQVPGAQVTHAPPAPVPQAPAAPATQTREAPTTHAPATQSPAPQAPRAPVTQAPQAPAPQSPQAPVTQAPQAPAPQSPQAPVTQAPQAPAPQSPQAPVTQAPQAPAPQSPHAPVTQAPEAPAPHSPQPPATKSPTLPRLRRPRPW